ncbi:MAG: alpha,alpha-trehalose-phosphate synthase (UDP-forming) [Gammaproteobacteria bacterium]
MTDSGRDTVIVVSNRLPLVLCEGQDETWEVKPGSGGLVTALVPVLRNRGGLWIGWPGTTEKLADVQGALARATRDAGYGLIPVMLTADEAHDFYLGFSNEIIWPLFHDLQYLCNFDPAYWQVYIKVNRKYAQVIAQQSRASAFIWVHDYHLMNIGAELHRMGVDTEIGFFLHIPFPSPDMFLKLPWRQSILRALLEYEVIGFQTLRDRRNFVQCLRALVKDVALYGKGQVVLARVGDHEVRIGHFPISIDAHEFAKAAANPEVASEALKLRALLGDRQLILGVDRLDYTKGILQRLTAFYNALSRYPDLQERVTLVQVVVPSREDIPRYHELRTQIEQLVGRINGELTRPGVWVPIHYLFRNLTRIELLAYYRAAEIALITPLKDGMNLVAKEYCMCSLEEDSVLILSEFAGAAAQLRHGALLVNPYDVEGVADTLHRAFTMDKDERQRRMRKLRRSIRKRNVFWWVDAFLRAAIAKDLSAFPMGDYSLYGGDARDRGE